MILNKEEAICVVLSYAKNKIINSQTKLNKLLARLNYYMVPIEIDFTLNKYGSFSPDTESLMSNEFFEVNYYKFEDKKIPKYSLTTRGGILATKTIQIKLMTIFKPGEMDRMKKDIFELSLMSASEISEEEHKKLLIDEEEREKLKMRINSVHIDTIDLYHESKKMSKDNYADLTLAALIEYCFYLTQYLMQKRFKNIAEMKYDFNAYMLDYYYLWNLETQVIPFLKHQLTSRERDEIVINRYYQYIVNFARSKNYPFSLDNPDLRKLIAV